MTVDGNSPAVLACCNNPGSALLELLPGNEISVLCTSKPIALNDLLIMVFKKSGIIVSTLRFPKPHIQHATERFPAPIPDHDTRQLVRIGTSDDRAFEIRAGQGETCFTNDGGRLSRVIGQRAVRIGKTA